MTPQEPAEGPEPTPVPFSLDPATPIGLEGHDGVFQRGVVAPPPPPTELTEDGRSWESGKEIKLASVRASGRGFIDTFGSMPLAGRIGILAVFVVVGAIFVGVLVFMAAMFLGMMSFIDMG